MAVELLQQQPSPLDAVFVCVGGGGLLAGIAAYTKFPHPATRIVACEADDAACFFAALLQFLNALDPRWNISPFHYRNHGAAVGRVLAGIQVPDDALNAFHDALERLAYPYTVEHDHPAVSLFLR